MVAYYLPPYLGMDGYGEGETLAAAIENALDSLFPTFPNFDTFKNWSLQAVNTISAVKKDTILEKSRGYDGVELIEMNAEARDWKITGNTTPARYPLANGIAQAKGVMLVSVLTAWSNQFTTAFSRLSTLIYRQEKAIDDITATTIYEELRPVLVSVLEQAES